MDKQRLSGENRQLHAHELAQKERWWRSVSQPGEAALQSVLADTPRIQLQVDPAATAAVTISGQSSAHQHCAPKADLHGRPGLSLTDAEADAILDLAEAHIREVAARLVARRSWTCEENPTTPLKTNNTSAERPAHPEPMRAKMFFKSILRWWSSAQQRLAPPGGGPTLADLLDGEKRAFPNEWSAELHTLEQPVPSAAARVGCQRPFRRCVRTQAARSRPMAGAARERQPEQLPQLTAT